MVGSAGTCGPSVNIRENALKSSTPRPEHRWASMPTYLGFRLLELFLQRNAPGSSPGCEDCFQQRGMDEIK